MEFKINRLATLFAFLFLFIAIFHFSVELLSPRVHLYCVLNHQKPENLQTEYDIKDFTLNSLFVKCLDSVEPALKYRQVEMDEDVYFRLKEGDSLYLYFTPYKLEARALLDQHQSQFHSLKNPSDFRYPLQLKYIVLPTLVVLLSLLVIFLPYFEIKIALFMFDVIVLMVLQWFNP